MADHLKWEVHVTKEPERHWTVHGFNQDRVVKYTIHTYQGMKEPEAWPNGGKKWCQRRLDVNQSCYPCGEALAPLSEDQQGKANIGQRELGASRSKGVG